MNKKTISTRLSSRTKINPRTIYTILTELDKMLAEDLAAAQEPKHIYTLRNIVSLNLHVKHKELTLTPIISKRLNLSALPLDTQELL